MRNIILRIAGTLALTVGGIGIVVPVLPTTPFVLAAAACFGSSSPRVYKWLVESRFFGEYIRSYRYNGGISRRTWIQSLIVLCTGLTISIAVTRDIMIALLLVVIGIAVTIHICWLRRGARR